MPKDKDKPKDKPKPKRKSAYTKLAEEVAARESAFQTAVPGMTNMQASLGNLATQTGVAGTTINPSEIPAVAALANLRASATTASQDRATYSATRAKQMPSYINAYRKYLKWRYPSTYSGGSSGSSGGGTSLPGYQIPELTLPPLPTVPGAK